MTNSHKSKLIVILGPNASGKSKLAVELARKFNGEIISADSRQVYHGMDIGTGKVPRDKSKIKNQKSKLQFKSQNYFHKGIRHYLLDMAHPKRRFTVAQYKKLALAAIKKIQRKNKVPIICGGTGFYIQAITDNFLIPEVKPDLKLRARFEKKKTEELFNELKKLDPARAKNIDRHNPRRLIRALEIIYKTGKPIPSLVIPAKAGMTNSKSGFRFKPGMTNEDFDILFIGVKKSPAEQKKLIHTRLLKRLSQGMIEEVKKLRKSGLSWKRLESFGLEYRWIAKYLQNLKQLSFRGQRPRNLPRMRADIPQRSFAAVRMTKEKLYAEMIFRLQKDIEHYAKRQMTWFNRNKRIKWIKNAKQAKNLADNFLLNNRIKKGIF